MTLFPAFSTDDHTFGQWQWTKLSPGLLRVTGGLTFELLRQTSTWQISVWASSRRPPLWPLGVPSLHPLLLPLKPTPASPLFIQTINNLERWTSKQIFMFCSQQKEAKVTLNNIFNVKLFCLIYYQTQFFFFFYWTAQLNEIIGKSTICLLKKKYCAMCMGKKK